MQPVISIRDLNKTYAGGFEALKSVSLEIDKGEIFGLLGPNGAGKTTMINIICGIVTKTSGRVGVAGHDNIDDYRKTRSMIGLVPQELPAESFETPYTACRFSRGLFGKPEDPGHIEKVLKSRGLKQTEAAKLMGVTQPRVSDLLRGRLELFSSDALIDMLARLGVRVRLVTTTPRSRELA